VILITGGAGYIGSHMAGYLQHKSNDFLIIDNLSNSSMSNLYKLENFYKKKIKFIKVDLKNDSELDILFNSYKFDSVLHFAALKSTEDSKNNPKSFYENNVIGSQNLINKIKKYKINNFIFSSSASVYGQPKYLPIDEEHSLIPLNPYAEGKLQVENFLRNDEYFINKCSTKILRFFNPLGCYKNALIGENHTSKSTNIMPNILDVALKRKDHLKIFGDDFQTHDGTAVRDFIHILDLVECFYNAIEFKVKGIQIFNIGTGKGTSILDLVKIFEEVNSIKIPYKIVNRRFGDIESSYTTTEKIEKKLYWRSHFDIRKMCKDAYLYALSVK